MKAGWQGVGVQNGSHRFDICYIDKDIVISLVAVRARLDAHVPLFALDSLTFDEPGSVSLQ